jgi:hypothetical protein
MLSSGEGRALEWVAPVLQLETKRQIRIMKSQKVLFSIEFAPIHTEFDTALKALTAGFFQGPHWLQLQAYHLYWVKTIQFSNSKRQGKHPV